MTKLNAYQNKRDFSVTGEPMGSVKKSGRELKFCVQHHLARADHYDLRLEWKGVALSWAVPKGPSYSTADKRLAMRVEDHPVDYMDFEGVIPKGEYGGGTVMLWDEGVWFPRFDFAKGLKDGSLKFTLCGERLKGSWALVRMKNEGSENGEPWLLIKEKDGYARKAAGISRYARGVRSGKTMKEIAAAGGENPFRKAEVMLARLTEELPTGRGWLYELKYDGHRVLAFTQHGNTTLQTRNGADCTEKFILAAEGVSKALKGRAAVLDGEMIAVGKDGMPDFGALQSQTRPRALCYVLFDLLALDGVDLRGLPLSERKEKLKALLDDAPTVLKYSASADRMTKAQCEKLKKQGWEGIVIKRADSPYTAGKNGDWQKLKFRNVREFIVGGYTLTETGGLKALLVGHFDGNELVFAGNVGTGFSEAARRTLLQIFKPIVRSGSPFAAIPKGCGKNAVWLEPKVVVQMEFAEITAAGRLRQASYKGLREDKEAEQVVAGSAEAAGPRRSSEKRKRTAKTQAGPRVHGVTITHPEKVMFPRQGITKGELADYYAAVAPRMLPYLKERKLSLVCCPSGIAGEKFFRRHLEGDFAGVGITEGGDFYVKSETGVMALAQYNAVEFHVQGVKRSSQKPDIMVFDLDPDEGLPLSKVRQGVRELKKTLDGLGLVSFLKTSGGKGYHLVVPFRAGMGAEKFKEFARRVALLMEERFPGDFTANLMKKARTGKIFLDWQRNSPGATSAAPYSLRARDGASVSMPIAWTELSRVAPDGITLKTALKRLDRPDPWADFFEVKKRQTLKE